MPLTKKGTMLLKKFIQQYGSTKKGKQVFYASRNAGTITGVDPESGGKHEEKKKI